MLQRRRLVIIELNDAAKKKNGQTNAAKRKNDPKWCCKEEDRPKLAHLFYAPDPPVPAPTRFPPPVFASKDQLPKYCKLQYKCQFLLIFHWKCRDIMENCPRNRIIFYCKMAFMLKFAVSTDCAPESSRPAGTTLQTSRAPPDRPSNLPPNEPGKEGTSG